jgi:hypothetical protein
VNKTAIKMLEYRGRYIYNKTRGIATRRRERETAFLGSYLLKMIYDTYSNVILSRSWEGAGRRKKTIFVPSLPLLRVDPSFDRMNSQEFEEKSYSRRIGV